jgi:O-methyltransferase
MIRNLLRTLLAPLGLTVGRTLPGGQLLDPARQDAFEAAYAMVRASTMLNRQRACLLYELTQHLIRSGVPGAFVECGAWKGGGAGLMALAARANGGEPGRDLYLCDAFDDIGEPDWRVDGERAVREAGGRERAEGRLAPITGIYAARGGPGTIEECRALIETRIGWPAARLHFRKGWFQETMAPLGAEIGPIALLHIDGDWYASTRACLEGLFERVSSHGAIVVDDYGAYDGARKAVDEFLAARGLTPFLNHVDQECVHWFKG